MSKYLFLLKTFMYKSNNKIYSTFKRQNILKNHGSLVEYRWGHSTYKHLGYRVAWLGRHSLLSSGWGHLQTRHPRPPADPAVGTPSQTAAVPIACIETKQIENEASKGIFSSWKLRKLKFISWAFRKYYILKIQFKF